MLKHTHVCTRVNDYRGVKEGLRVHPQAGCHALVARAPLEAVLGFLVISDSFALSTAVVRVALSQCGAVFSLPRGPFAVAENIHV